MFCKICGNQLDDNAKFCPKCGNKIANEIFQNDLIKLNYEENKEDKKPKNKKKKKNRKRRWFFSLVLILSLIIILIYISKKNKIFEANSETFEAEVTDYSNTIYQLDVSAIKYDEYNGVNYVSNMIIIFLTKDATDENLNSLLEDLDGEIAGSLPEIRQYQIKISSRDYLELNNICKKLEQLDFVEMAYIDLAYEDLEQTFPNDTWNDGTPIDVLLNNNLWNTDNPEGRNWWLEAINAPEAWDYNDYYSNIAVGIVDDGFDTTHVELKNKIKKVSSNNDVSKHGTFVAGIIGAEANNDEGITGIVWNSDIYTYDWKDENWNSTTYIYAGVINLIMKDNAKVINLSAGISEAVPKSGTTKELVDEYGKTASKYLLELLEIGKDFVIVQSAGNGCTDTTSIDSIYNGFFCSINEDNCVYSENISKEDILDRVIVVGAAQNEGDNEYVQAEDSNAGEGVDICAPGVDIYSTSTDGYAVGSGTSASAPIVTGVAALVWSANEDLTGSEVKKIVCAEENTKYEVKDNDSKKHPLNYSYRMVNAQLAVEAALNLKLTNETDLDLEDLTAEELNYRGIVIKPEDVVLKAFDAMDNNDFEKFINCCDPSTEKIVNTVGSITTFIAGDITGHYNQWDELVNEELMEDNVSDIEVIDCYSYDYEYVAADITQSGILTAISDFNIPFVSTIVCNEANVYIKYRYKVDGQWKVDEDDLHVKRYGISGWRIKCIY